MTDDERETLRAILIYVAFAVLALIILWPGSPL